ncbi:MAG: hypothetical protein K8T25_22550 [Planctomycetia bacterium]|nr:hypothetical protein [Planctomycetia bacterium]
MATRMGGHDVIRVGFDVRASAFRELQYVLGLIMCGYESRLVTESEPGAAPDLARDIGSGSS